MILLGGKITVHAGDCLDVIRTLASDSVDAGVTDPPYALVSIGKRYGKSNLEQPADKNLDGVNAGAFRRLAGGFMGKAWDTGDVAHSVEFWAEVLRVLKPGAHLLAFGGTRTYHRLACAIEDAGFEIRDQIGWAFGQGFPKSLNIGNGLGTALKPAWEPICLARKPLSEGTVAANVLRWGTGAINVDGCRVVGDVPATTRGNSFGRLNDDGWQESVTTFSPSALGRWPANLIHDGSDEVIAAFPESVARPAQAIINGGTSGSGKKAQSDVYGGGREYLARTGYADSETSAARFFYSAKADSDDRLGSRHPTVKPLDLMQYLVRLVTPKGGTVLDCFAGTGVTAEAAVREGARAILIEREPEYLADIERRCSLILAGPSTRLHATIKAKGKAEDAGPLFEVRP